MNEAGNVRVIVHLIDLAHLMAGGTLVIDEVGVELVPDSESTASLSGCGRRSIRAGDGLGASRTRNRPTRRRANRMAEKLCQHCGRDITRLAASKNVRRGLCRPCYRSVRKQYEAKFAGLNRRRRLPPEPTEADPGSPEKIRVMMARYEAGFLVFHPDDTVLCYLDGDGYDC